MHNKTDTIKYTDLRLYSKLNWFSKVDIKKLNSTPIKKETKIIFKNLDIKILLNSKRLITLNLNYSKTLMKN